MAKKTPVRKGAAQKKSTRRARLEKELSALLSEIDEEGLVFLFKQANVLIHNARVDRIDREVREPQDSKEQGADGRVAPGGQPAAAPDRVAIEEQEGGKVFFLVIGGARKVLSLEELRRIIRICRSAETKSDGLRQLYTVLSRERSDILFDARIKGPSHPLLDALFTEVRSRYRLKEG
jgi:hypothetical protein